MSRDGWWARRKARREARRAASAQNRREMPQRVHEVIPPEGVPLSLTIASMGARFGAQLFDLLLTGLASVALVIAIALLVDASWNLIGGLLALLFFFVRAPYYVATELIYGGRTPGKRLMRLRVISADGRSLATYAVVLRNLMKEAEVFVPGTLLLIVSAQDPVSAILMLSWIVIVLAIPLCNKRRQRLGDIIARTIVVEEPQALLMPELAERQKARFSFQPHHLDHYGAYELQTLERVLRAATEWRGKSAQIRRDNTLAVIVGKIRARTDYVEPVAEADHLAFLEDFYAAQRQHLEARQLMGERRADKHHRTAAEASQPDKERS
ncbi:MAG: RDD family protein [Pseudomonadota bacterium]